MKHVDFEISLFTDGELPDEGQGAFFAHLAECTSCRKKLHSLYGIKNSVTVFYNGLKSGSEPSAPPKSIPGTKPATSRKSASIWYSVAASLALLCCSIWLFYSRHELELKYAFLESAFSTQYESPARYNSRNEEALSPSRLTTSTRAIKGTKTDRKKPVAKPTKLTPKAAGKVTFNNLEKTKNFATVTITREDFIGTQMVGN